mmetsp:Transcript_32221/g.110876  ORF Transcript_32221/g.110876 Transcript_32221/m.110876 type:complete len:217 (+) Transcript_32221:713-1363(+)
MEFQYCTTSSLSVQSRTTTQTGIVVKGRRAAATSPSEASPSEAITTTAFWPRCLSCASCCRSSATIASMAAQRGVLPVGDPAMSCWIAPSSFAEAASALPTVVPTVTTRGPAAWFRRRKDVQAPSSMASLACHSMLAQSSSHLVQETMPSLPWCLTNLDPSTKPMLPELSMIQYRSAKSFVDLRNDCARPLGSCSWFSKTANVSASERVVCERGSC